MDTKVSNYETDELPGNVTERNLYPRIPRAGGETGVGKEGLSWGTPANGSRYRLRPCRTE